MDSMCGVYVVGGFSTHYHEKCGCGNGKHDHNLKCLLKKGIFCSLILKPSRDLPIRVTSHQLYFLNFVLWTAYVVLMKHVLFHLITLKSVGVGMVNLTTTQNIFFKKRIFCSLVLKPSRDLPIRVTFCQL